MGFKYLRVNFEFKWSVDSYSQTYKHVYKYIYIYIYIYIYKYIIYKIHKLLKDLDTIYVGDRGIVCF